MHAFSLEVGIFLREAVTTAAALLIGLAQASAFDTGKLGQHGSMHLDDLMPLISGNTRLKRQVNHALAQSKKKVDEVECFGRRFPGQWEHLSGERVSPYTCDFDTKYLRIYATVRITDRGGRRYETITAEAKLNASNVLETNLTWKWTKEPPDDDN
jgi:hypothetical protein